MIIRENNAQRKSENDPVDFQNINIQAFLETNNKDFGFIDKESKIIGKKSNQKDFDILVFAYRDIKHAQIPSFINEIGKNSFKDCYKLKSIDLPISSKLKIINENAFSNSSLQKINFPSNLQKIKKNAFGKCSKLKKVKFEPNSQISVIDIECFQQTPISSIILPLNINCIRKNAFNFCVELRCIECLGDDIYFEQNCFDNCIRLSIISCPNAKQIFFDVKNLKNDMIIFLNHNTLIL